LKKGKTALLMMLAMLFVVSATINLVSAQPMTLAVDPAYKEIQEEDIGKTFTVNVTISNAPADPGVAGIQFILEWNSSVVKGVNIELPTGHFMTPDGDTANLWIIWLSAYDGYAEYGVTYYDMNRSIEMGYVPKSGGGVLATITFNSTAAGTTTLSFTEVVIGDAEGNSLDFTTESGTIVVIPEFPAFLLLPVFMIATLVAIIITKRTWLRNTRC